MKRRSWLAMTGAVVLLMAGCGKKQEGGALTEWRVGAYLSLSGPQTQFGVDTREGIELAVDEVNKAGGVRGRPMKLLVEDDKSNNLEANSKVLQLIDRDKVIALLGEIASERSKAGGIVANRKKIPMITPSSTNPDVTRSGPFAFRVCFTDDAQGTAGARFVAATLKKRKVALLFASDDLYSSGLAKSFREEAARQGLEVVAEKSFLKTETNFTTYINELEGASPEVVYAPIYYNAMIPIARQAKAAGVKGSMFVGTDGWHAEALVKDAGQELEGAYLTDHFAPDMPDGASVAFVKSYRDRYHHDPSSIAAMGYDAAKLLADALGRARADTPEAVRDAIAETKSFPGATGPISINADRNADKPVVMVQIHDGKFTYHSTIEATAK